MESHSSTLSEKIEYKNEISSSSIVCTLPNTSIIKYNKSRIVEKKQLESLYSYEEKIISSHSRDGYLSNKSCSFMSTDSSLNYKHERLRVENKTPFCRNKDKSPKISSSNSSRINISKRGTGRSPYSTTPNSIISGINDSFASTIVGKF